MSLMKDDKSKILVLISSYHWPWTFKPWNLFSKHGLNYINYSYIKDFQTWQGLVMMWNRFWNFRDNIFQGLDSESKTKLCIFYHSCTSFYTLHNYLYHPVIDQLINPKSDQLVLYIMYVINILLWHLSDDEHIIVFKKFHKTWFMN